MTDYALSKRTDVYVEGVYQHASGELGNFGANVAAINTLAPSSTGNQVAAAVGLRHRFQVFHVVLAARIYPFLLRFNPRVTRARRGFFIRRLRFDVVVTIAVGNDGYDG